MMARLLLLSFLAMIFLAWHPEIIFAESISVEGQNVSYEISSGKISSITLDQSAKELIVNIQSQEDGTLTITIPRMLLDSKLKDTDDVFYVIKNGMESSYSEKVTSNIARTIDISFLSGDTKILIMGTESDIKTQTTQNWQNQNAQSQEKNGCLIATATYGTELAPQVQMLREIRDNVLFNTDSGTAFMSGFNKFYYSFSPVVSDWERQNPIFKEAVKVTITPMLSTLTILNYVDIDSEQEILGYGIGLILLNTGIYFVMPALVILKIKQRFS